ncbi:hypothetical protein TNCV_731591 [Trichonephila clavipes]|nr:hypothetical protein TNCV_731591 [Trichonephila clavipes]
MATPGSSLTPTPLGHEDKLRIRGAINSVANGRKRAHRSSRPAIDTGVRISQHLLGGKRTFFRKRRKGHATLSTGNLATSKLEFGINAREKMRALLREGHFFSLIPTAWTKIAEHHLSNGKKKRASCVYLVKTISERSSERVRCQNVVRSE